MPPAKKPTPAADLIDLLIRRAPALYAAGVTSLSMDGFAVTLSAPASELPDAEDAPPPPKQHIDPMQDPASYPSGRVPGFTRPQATGGDS